MLCYFLLCSKVTQSYIHICVYIYTLYIHIYLHMYTCVCIYTNICIYMHTYTLYIMYAHVYTHYIYICVYIYIHTHILFLILSSIMVYPKRLDTVPCAVQQDLIAYPTFWGLSNWESVHRWSHCLSGEIFLHQVA